MIFGSGRGVFIEEQRDILGLGPVVLTSGTKSFFFGYCKLKFPRDI